MRRRDFLAGLVAAGAWGCGSSGARALVAEPPPATRGTVLVVGAGMAGLGAARTLRQAGFAVEVLEGRSRLGGRIRTDRSLGGAVDLGASWIHGPRGNPITALADEFGVERIPTDFESGVLYDAAGQPVPAAEQRELDGAWDLLQLEFAARGLVSEAPTVQALFDELLAGEELTEREQRYLNFRLGTFEVMTGEDLANVSAQASDGSGLGGGDALVVGGYGRIVEGLAAGLTVHLDTRVRRVTRTADGVQIQTDGRTWTGAAAVVTASAGVLASGAIAFEPGLPAAKTEALSVVGMGTLNKVALGFPRRFWPTEPHFLMRMSARRGDLNILLTQYGTDAAPILVAFLGGTEARRIEQRPDAAAVDRVMAVLRAQFGADVPAPTGALVTRWNSDPFALGAYSHLRPGGTSDHRDALAAPHADRVFFAGEATHRKHPSTVHGAWLSGAREGERVAAALG